MNPLSLLIPDQYKAGTLFAQIGGDYDVDRASTATRVNSAGLIESVANNVPRFDYSGGVSCPALLREEEATNAFVRSEEFDNASWTKVAGAITANTSIAPDGATTADTFTADGTNSSHRFFQSASGVSGTTYTASWYVKRGTADFVQIIISGATPFGLTSFANFNLLNGTIGTTGGLQTNSQISFNAVTGYYRISSQITAIGTGSGQVDLCIVPSASATRLQAFASSATIICWGAMFNAGGLSSYIPTIASAVTRLADVISKTDEAGAATNIVTFEDGSTFEEAASGTITLPVGRIINAQQI